MGKKYTPSGYQIIDLGTIDLSTTPKDILKGVNADVDKLIELYANGKLNNKPILLSFYAANFFGKQITVIPSCLDNLLQFSNMSDDATGVWSVVIYVTNNKITYQALSVDF